MRRGTVIFFRLAFLLYIAAVIYLCFGHFDNVQGVKWSYFGIPTDKIVHFCMFFPFVILSNWAIGRRPKKWYRGVAEGILLGMLGLGIAALTEVGQSMLTNWRAGDINDFKADQLAVEISTILVIILNIFRSLRK